MPGQRSREQAVHAAHRVADAHRAERIPVIAAADGEKPVLLGPSQGKPVLQAYLDCHLDRHRPSVGKEHMLEAIRAELDQPCGQANRGFVGKPAEHHVRHPLELVAHRRIEHRVAVAVDHAPPRCHPVDQLPPVLKPQADAGGGRHRQRRDGRHRAIRMPDMPLVELHELNDFHNGGSLRGRDSRASICRVPRSGPLFRMSSSSPRRCLADGEEERLMGQAIGESIVFAVGGWRSALSRSLPSC
jgi:hypothetical protein